MIHTPTSTSRPRASSLHPRHPSHPRAHLLFGRHRLSRRTDPSTGQPGTQLLPCSTPGADVTFESSLSPNSTVTSTTSSLCLDITSHLTTPCAGVEGYGCNGGANQAWTLPLAASAGAVTSAQDGHCLSIAATD